MSAETGGWCAPTETPGEMLAEYHRQCATVPEDAPVMELPSVTWEPSTERDREWYREYGPGNVLRTLDP